MGTISSGPGSQSTCSKVCRIGRGAQLGAIVRKERNVLFNDAVNTFYLRLYGVTHMVKDHSDSERGNPLPTHGLLFLINSKGSYMHHLKDRMTHTTVFVTPVVEHWLEREIWLKGGPDSKPIPCSTNFLGPFYRISSVCWNVETKGKVFWKYKFK